MKVKNGRVERFINKIGSQTDLSAFQNFYFEMNSENDISIHGCRDIAEYDDNKILVKTDKFLIKVAGKNLKVEKYSLNFTNICGNISGIDFSVIRREN